MLIKIATRQSKLALIQTDLVVSKIKECFPNAVCEIVPVISTGDKITDKNLYDIGGKALFLKELEEKLIAGEVDLAVHSLKDVPGILPPDLELAAVLEREDPRDCFVSHKYKSVQELPRSALVGSSSVRRMAILHKMRPDLEIKQCRGNVQTRLRKLIEEGFDAIILACAGLKRADLFDENFCFPLSVDEMLPAAGQGIIAIEKRVGDDRMAVICAKINHEPTWYLAEAERAFLAYFDASCRTPISSYAVYFDEQTIQARYMYGDESLSHPRADGDLNDNPLHYHTEIGGKLEAREIALRAAKRIELLLLQDGGARRVLSDSEELGRPELSEGSSTKNVSSRCDVLSSNVHKPGLLGLDPSLRSGRIKGTIKTNCNLKHLTWFKVGGDADIFFKPEDTEDLAVFLKENNGHLPVTVIGAGSNLIIRDKGVEGVVVKLGRNFTTVIPLLDRGIHGAQGEKMDSPGPAPGNDNRDDASLLSVGAGCLNFNLAKFCLENSISGFEFLVGIPGTIGGGIAMNAGAYGREFKDIVHSVQALDNKGNILNLSLKDIGFGYRSNSLPKDLIFTKVFFNIVTKAAPGDIKRKMDEINASRKSTQPITEKTGGSTFANPPGHKAWELIDSAGMRGARVGDACMSNMHCNFMINLGAATASDMEELGELVIAKVKEHSGVELKWEIKRVGRG